MNSSIALPSIEIIDIEESKFSPLISHCAIKVCYVSDEPNRNKSIINKETALKMAPSLRGAAIVGYYNETAEDFEEHNRIIDISNGKFEVKDTTRPYGFVDLNAKCWFQDFNDNGVIHKYLMTEGWLWTGQYEEAKRIIEKGNNQSMELDEKLIDAYWTKDAIGKPQFFIINEAIISKLCILGEDVEPCFEGASISKLQFSFEDSFKEQLFSMMNEMKNILNEGGAPKMTTYTVEIGSPLWNSLYDHVNETHKIVAVMTEDDQTFAVLQSREDESYGRMNFSFNEEVFSAEEITALESYEPAEEAQFSLEAVEAFEAEYKKQPAKEGDEEKKDDGDEDKCPKCGKPKSECNCEDEEDDDEDKKKKYTLEEIPEYVALQTAYTELETKYNALVAEKETQDATISSLTEYKVAAERKEKMEMINTQFYMLSDDLKADVIENIDTYSLAEIEAKLSVICVRNKVNFNLDDDKKTPGTDPMTYNLNGGSLEDDAIPAWIKAVMATAKTLN